MRNWLRTIVVACIISLAGGYVLADYTFKDSGGVVQTAFSFVCSTSKVCPATVLINSSNIEVGTAAVPLQVSIANTGANATAAKVNIASGGVASGAVASGAYASGAFASGAVASGAVVDLGAQADTACASDNGSCSLIALQKRTNQNLTSGIVAVGTPGVPSTTNVLSVQSPCNATAIYDASTNGSTELVALTSGKTIYVCGLSILAGGTANVKLIYGTGTACATGSTNLTPAWQLTAQVGLVNSNVPPASLATAASNALCINTSAGQPVQAMVHYFKTP